MAEYIDKQAFLERMKKADRYFMVKFDIESFPAAEVEQVRHGHWIEASGYQICSECGEEHAWDEYRASYCEDCGARMDGGADNGETAD